MSFCPQCGSQIRPGTAFCVSCGTALAVPAPMSAPAHQQHPTAPHPTTARPPYAAAATQYAGPPPVPGNAPRTSPQVDLTRLLRGNWVGAAQVALVVLATSGLASLALALLAKPADFGIDNTLTLVAVIMTGAFGADLVVDGRIEDFEGAGSGGWIPLTVTLLTCAAAIWSFRRMVRPYPRPWPAVGDAARVALLVAVPLCIIALAFRSSGDEYGRGWAGEMAAELSGDDRLMIGASAAGAFFLGLLLVFVVLALVVVCRRGWWNGRLATVVEWLHAPVLGLATMAALLPLAGLIGFGLLMFGGNDLSDESMTTDDTMAVIAVVVGYLANGGAMLVSLGSLASLGSKGEATGESDVSEMHRLWWYTNPSHGDEPGLWAAPLVTVLLLVAGAYVVARSSRSRETVLRDLLVWAASMLVFVPLMVRVSSGHGSFSISGEGEDFDATGYVGPEGWQVTLMFLLLAVVVALVVARLRGALDTSRLRALASQLQSSPATAHQPSAHQPSAQQWQAPQQQWQEPPTQAQQWGPPRP